MGNTGEVCAPKHMLVAAAHVRYKGIVKEHSLGDATSLEVIWVAWYL
jgi:hypothetical protein